MKIKECVCIQGVQMKIEEYIQGIQMQNKKHLQGVYMEFKVQCAIESCWYCLIRRLNIERLPFNFHGTYEQKTQRKNTTSQTQHSVGFPKNNIRI